MIRSWGMLRSGKGAIAGGGISLGGVASRGRMQFAPTGGWRQWEQHGVFDGGTDGLGDVTFAVETVGEQLVGVVVLLELVLLLGGELPVVAGVAMGDHDLTKLVCPGLAMALPPLPKRFGLIWQGIPKLLQFILQGTILVEGTVKGSIEIQGEVEVEVEVAVTGEVEGVGEIEVAAIDTMKEVKVSGKLEGEVNVLGEVAAAREDKVAGEGADAEAGEGEGIVITPK